MLRDDTQYIFSQFADQLIFIFKISVDSAGGNTSFIGYLLHRQALQPFGGDDFLGRIEYQLAFVIHDRFTLRMNERSFTILCQRIAECNSQCVNIIKLAEKFKLSD